MIHVQNVARVECFLACFPSRKAWNFFPHTTSLQRLFYSFFFFLFSPQLNYMFFSKRARYEH